MAYLDYPGLQRFKGKLDEGFNELKTALNAGFRTVSDITEGLTTAGLTWVKTDRTHVTIYGTSTNTGVRYMAYLNGGNMGILTSASVPIKTFRPGIYRISYAFTGARTTNKVYITKNKCSDYESVTSGAVVYINAPFAIITNVAASSNFGTEGNPTYLYINVELLDAWPNNMLQSTGDTTDRKDEIRSILSSFGSCILGSGTFYMSSLTMPEGSILIGSGEKTKVIFASGETGSVIQATSGCTITNLQLDGGLTEIPDSAGSRNGISFSTDGYKRCIISECFIHGFNKAGILLQDTGYGVDSSAAISDCTVTNCYYGIGILKNSEYHTITNCHIDKNYYGMLNRGGNNKVANCGFDGNVINCQYDEDEGSNSGHGSIVGCSFNHSNANQNDGYSLIIKGTGAMAVSGCQFHYGKIRLESSSGNTFSGCKLGNDTEVEIVNGACSVFIGCMVGSLSESPISITNNSLTVFANCYAQSTGSAWTPV